jgi:hypothetical protein
MSKTPAGTNARERIDTCIQCGLSLPLFKPSADEAAQSYACAFCGTRYRAVLDDAAPEDERLHVRIVE